VATARRTMPPVDVLIVDDHHVFAEVLAMRLVAEGHSRSVTVASSLSAARTKLRAMGDGLVLLDYHLGDEAGLDLLGDIALLPSTPKVVVLSGSRDADEIVTALYAGADGWLVKNEGFDTLVDVAADVWAGTMRLPSSALRDVIRRLQHLARPQRTRHTFLDDLSAREREVLECLTAGLPRDEIAERLFISRNTVRTHVQNLLKRADVHSTVALVARAQEAGLVESRGLPHLTPR